MTPPGGLRTGEWVPSRAGPDLVTVPHFTRSGFEMRVAVARGFDCRQRCEHVPPRPNEGGSHHGQHTDELHLQMRRAELAAELTCFSWIRNGEKVARPEGISRPLIYAAMLFVHHEAKNGASRPCRLFEHSGCTGVLDEPLGYIGVEGIWGQQESDLVAPIVLARVDDIDLRAVMTALGPWWNQLAPFCVEKAHA